jgi:AraC family transcriptional regulator
MSAAAPDDRPCEELRRPDGQPVLTLPSHWAGLPLGLYSIPGVAELGPCETACPTILVARCGEGERWYRSAGRSHHLRTAPGMIEIYPQGLEFDRMRWAGRAGHCIAIHLQPHALRSLTRRDRDVDLLRQHEVFDERLQWIARELLAAAHAGGPDTLYVEGLSLALLGRLEQRGSVTHVEGKRGGRIAEELGSELSIARLAREACMSADHFSHCFKQTFGVPPHRFVQQQRVAAAQRLLRRGDLSIAQIAVSVGFANQSHFTQVFRQWTGVTPGQWR